MPTLFDALQQKLSQPATPVIGDQQSSLANTFRAKTGKATTSTGPGASSIGQDSAMNNVAGAVGQQQVAGQVAATQLATTAQQQQQQQQTAQNNLATQNKVAQIGMAGQRQQSAEQNAGTEDMANSQTQFTEQQKQQQMQVTADQKLRDLAAERGLSVDNVFRDFESSNKDLAFRKDQAQLEQAGFLLALRDKSYTDELSRIGKERDLNDKLNYTEESQRLVLGDNLDKTLQDIGFKTVLDADHRTWVDKIAQIDLNSAMAIAQANMKDASNAAVLTGTNQVLKGAGDYYSKNPSGDDSGDTGSSSKSEPSGGFTNPDGTSSSINGDYTLKNPATPGLDAGNTDSRGYS